MVGPVFLIFFAVQFCELWEKKIKGGKLTHHTPYYCSTIKGDIELLHSYFNSNYTQIIARGETTVYDPVNILFSAYMVIPCNNFRSYIKPKQDAYTDKTLTLMHKELIMLATNNFNLLKQEGMWGAKSPDEDIMAMQAELTALKGHFQLAPTSRRKHEPEMTTGKEARSKVEETTRIKRTRRTTLKRRSRRKVRTGRRHLPRKEKLTRRRSRDVPGVGASTTWHGATTRKSSADSAMSAPTADQWPQPSCSPSRLGNRPQPQVASPHGQHGPQHGRRLTGQTRMETMEDVLVRFHGGGKFKQGTSNHALPYSPIFPNHPVLVPYHVGGSLP